MLENTIHHYSYHRAACKQWSVLLGVAVLLLGALGRLSAINVLWAAAPMVLLAFVEAGYAGQQRRCIEALQARKAGDGVVALPSEGLTASVMRTILAVLSLSIWP